MVAVLSSITSSLYENGVFVALTCGTEACELSRWIEVLHESHCLYFGGGVCFCIQCGIVAAVARSRSTHLKLCEHKFVKGSYYRLDMLKQGKLVSSDDLALWPHGRDDSVCIGMRRVRPSAATTPLSTQPQIPQQLDYGELSSIVLPQADPNDLCP